VTHTQLFSQSLLSSLARQALVEAASGPVCSPNPQVGCLILDDAGSVLVAAHHQGAGSPHAEAAAIAAARATDVDLRGKTALVTLEPCSQTGRTPPCTSALIAAGVERVYFLVADPSGFGGGAAQLRAAGVEVFGPEELAADFAPELDLAQRLILPWTSAVARGRPYVIAKFATSMDGRIAAADGSSRWITSQPARRHVHQVRAQVDGILVGTGTVLADDPSLTVRLVDDSQLATADKPQRATSYQPRRIVLGQREIPAGARLHGAGGELIQMRSHDIAAALKELFARGMRQIVVEGGATVLAEFFRAGLVDEIHHYLAPVLLGAGPSVVGDFGVANISQAPRWRRQEFLDLAPDLLQILTGPKQKSASAVPGTWQVQS